MKVERSCHTCKFGSNSFGYPCSQCFTKIRGIPFPKWQPKTFEQRMDDSKKNIEKRIKHYD